MRMMDPVITRRPVYEVAEKIADALEAALDQPVSDLSNTLRASILHLRILADLERKGL